MRDLSWKIKSMIFSQILKQLAILLVIPMLFNACMSRRHHLHNEFNNLQKLKPLSRPYEINGKWYYPLSSAHGFKQIGYASWYGADFHGKRTANGEIYNMYELSAAHKTLPLGTYLKVHNLSNDKKIVIRINDRGPFIKGRIIDLSYSAAKKLDILLSGIAKVKIEAIIPNRFQSRSNLDYNNNKMNSGAEKTGFVIQVNAFKIMKNAYKLANHLKKYFKSVDVILSHKNDGDFYKVWVSNIFILENAHKVEKQLKKMGFNDIFILSQ